MEHHGIFREQQMVWHNSNIKCKERKGEHNAKNVILGQTMKYFFKLKKTLHYQRFYLSFLP